MLAVLGSPQSAQAQETLDHLLLPFLQSPVVQEIRIEGLQRVDEAGVRAKVFTPVGVALDRARLTEDVKRVFGLNFFDDVRVIEIPALEGGVALVFEVVERPTILAIKFNLDGDAVDLEDIQKQVDLKRFSILDEAAIKRNLAKIQELYIEEGHFLVDTRYTLTTLEGGVVVTLHVNEGAEVEVRSVVIVGNANVEASEIKEVLGTREGGYFSFLTKSGQFKRSLFEQDLQRIQLLYLTKGYIEVSVDDPVVTLSPDKESMTITIRVNEGTKYDVGTIAVEMASGTWLVPKDELMEDLVMEVGSTFSYTDMQADIQGLGDVFRDMGYANATVATGNKPDPETKTVDFTYTVQTGELVYIRRIEIRGNKDTRDKVIRREMKIEEGELFSQTGIRRSQARVRSLGFFDRVEVVPRPTDRPDQMDLVVTVKENNTGTFQVGAGFSSLESFIFTAQVKKDNFMGRGQTLSAQAILSFLRQQFQLSFFEPYLFDSNITFAFDVFNFNDDLVNFDRRRTGGNISLGYRVTDWLGMSLTYTLEDVEAEYATGTITPKIFEQRGLTSSARLTLSFDSRNNRIQPTDGQYTTMSIEHASKYLGSTNEFTRLNLRSRWYFQLPLDLVFKVNGTFGWVFCLEDGCQVPIFERYFVGGIYTVRGFDRNSLGPAIYTASTPDGSLRPTNVGGTKQLIFNVELEIPLFPEVGIKGVLFFDAGNAWGEDEDLDPLGIRTSVGLGVRWQSPVGPLRFEWGFPLDPNDDEEPMVFEFTIGNSF